MMTNTCSTKILSGWVQRRLPLIIIASSVCGVVGFSQDPDPAAWQGKATDHALDASGSDALAQSVVSGGYHLPTDFPKEWGQGITRHSAPMAPTPAYSALGFGPDTVLPKDPRYLRSGDGGPWLRTKGAIRATIFAPTNAGGGPLATWRFGSLYDATLSNEWWRPDRLKATNVGLEQSSAQIAFNLRLDLRSEFWPDVKNKIMHRKP
jgi:hypothetical protein